MDAAGTSAGSANRRPVSLISRCSSGGQSPYLLPLLSGLPETVSGLAASHNSGYLSPVRRRQKKGNSMAPNLQQLRLISRGGY